MESSPKLKLKLVVDKSKRRVVFAEAGKDFVDFLFHVQALPIGTLARILAGKADSMDGSLGNLYKSIEGLEDMYFMMPRHKQNLLKPKFPNCGSNITFPFTLLLPSDSPSSSRQPHCYLCPTKDCTYRYCKKVTDDPSVKCPLCDSVMDRRVDFIKLPTGETGYVNELVKYVVMDDLVVKPMTIDSCIAMLKDKSAMFEDKFVDFGVDEGKFLLEALLQSKTVLSDVFLGKKGRNDVATITPLFYRP
ncbi:uncharacterized protein LOC115682199 [Syzygium oleosum]|uniref:uncharacterized protein LOC115682199 n=1 Tax=Syzygium oleosum TaxID=219896 RepID=UPI0011D27F52|nr:uncharacterized protein LOC115682199 [Syzygium oleosum]